MPKKRGTYAYSFFLRASASAKPGKKLSQNWLLFKGSMEAHNKYLLLSIRPFQEIEIPVSKGCERAQ